jgi:zinc transport system substrate-binding protein
MNTWLDRIQDAKPDMQIVDMSEGIERIPMVEHHHEGEEQEGEEHEEVDWILTLTSPRLVKLMSKHSRCTGEAGP